MAKESEVKFIAYDEKVTACMDVAVLDNAGSGSTSDVIAGIEWVVQNKDAYGIVAQAAWNTGE